MNFLNTTKTSFHSLMRECDKNNHIAHYDRVSITDFMMKNGYILIINNDPYCSPQWRFSIPFFFLWIILLALWMPFKWILTGKFYYKYENKLMVLHREWRTKLGI